MSEEEKYWGCTPVVTAHMEARMKASREYAKMVSNDDETPAQRANRARDFECGAIWEEGYSKKHGWHPASELPPVDENGNSSELITITWEGYLMRVYFHCESKEYSFWVESDDWNKQVKYGVNVKWWSYPPKEE